MHLAAQSSVSLSVADPMRDASLNVMGLLNVLEASAAAGARKVVFAASGGTLYGTPRRIPVAEDARRNVGRVSPYGITKAVALEYLAFYRRHRSLTSTALALANVFGPRQDPLGEAGVVSIFGAQMLAGVQPTIFGGGRQTRDYVFVTDVAEGFRRAADLADGHLVNLGTGRETDVNTIFRSLARIIGFGQPPLQGPWREGDIERTALDIRRARRVLDWRPRVALPEGLKTTVAWLREAGVPAKGAG
jgi:UDP-glucose 4-epimerase